MKVDHIVESKLVIHFRLPGVISRGHSGFGQESQLKQTYEEQWHIEVKHGNALETAEALEGVARKIRECLEGLR